MRQISDIIKYNATLITNLIRKSLLYLSPEIKRALEAARQIANSVDLKAPAKEKISGSDIARSQAEKEIAIQKEALRQLDEEHEEARHKIGFM